MEDAVTNTMLGGKTGNLAGNRREREGQEFFAEIFLFLIMTNEELNSIGGIILDAAITVHKELGPGLLESAYELALMYELMSRDLNVRRQVPVQLVFRGHELGKAYEIDLLVENEVIVEVKSVLDMHPIYTAQIITHLKLHNNRLGYLINFNVVLLKNGFKRIVYNF